jgi:hypothetical protein
MKPAPLVLVGTLAVLLFPAASRADVAPPDLCDDLGASCTTATGEAGRCQQTTCTRNDYSEGTPPRQVEYECNRCLPLPAGEDPSTTDGGGCAASGPRRFGPLLFVALAWAVYALRRRER